MATPKASISRTAVRKAIFTKSGLHAWRAANHPYVLTVDTCSFDVNVMGEVTNHDWNVLILFAKQQATHFTCVTRDYSSTDFSGNNQVMKLADPLLGGQQWVIFLVVDPDQERNHPVLLNERHVLAIL